MIVFGTLMLLATGVYSSMSSAECEPSHKVKCITSADILNASGHVNIYVGKVLTISLAVGQTCQWIKRGILITNSSHILNIQTMSEADSGEYTMVCRSQNGTSTSTTVHLHVITKRPIKPHLVLCNFSESASPGFKCFTDGYPNTSLKWSRNKGGKIITTIDGRVESQISSVDYYQMQAMCCASNKAGQECTQLYDIDLTNSYKDLTNSDHLNVTLSPGESLLMRCSVTYPDVSEWWKDNNKIKNAVCSSAHTYKACVLEDSHYSTDMVYVSVPSVNVHDSGTYTCRSEKQTKSVHVSVQAEGFLSVKLETSLIIKREQFNTTCLQANVFYHPFLQDCIWETPDNMKIKCLTEPWVTKHRNVRLCETLKTGEYKLNIEAGGINETKSISVCIADTPDIKMRAVNNTYSATTMSLVPANYSWMSCSNDSCEEDSDWEVLAQTSKIDLEVSCKKTIMSSLRGDQVSGLFVRFCLTNSVGHWCKKRPVHFQQATLAFVGHRYDANSTLLKTGCVFLLLALLVVTIILRYYVKKKKPKPQLHMIQMVAPNDNDYIYINFKDFAYDSKWEFPRENLELGKELGSGAFGMVLQATAYGIDKPGVSQQVAVKMLKEKHQAVEKEALMSELKMLTHIGQHANIVNLLGACTETGPIYLIFQYCCYGDLLNYLKDNSQHYHKSVTDAFIKERFSSLYNNHPSSKPAREMPSLDNYLPMHASSARGQENTALLTLTSTDEIDCFEDTKLFEGQEEDVQALTFDDLLSFAYQVAKGMEFLSSKNCIHRDLAARNVLITKGRMAKIGDFGLARDIDNDSNYVVRGNVRLPVKWMAPESIFQGMYTMKSDVWAYGILLWEIFSLGVTPYPGKKVDHTFYAMIERGFKMDCPYYANESVYNMMCKCWELDSCDRPSFSKLASFMAAQLTEMEEELYHNVLNSNSNDYQNAPSLLIKQDENKTAIGNDYSAAYKADGSDGNIHITNITHDGKVQM
ncbi:unnamed protein product [Knipowitschia caucasica]|uniref:receptor protein-tyrosine kinase n=1 Tax=Knipowitschia caucasica TaxID=637954 RepID=A0AAV2L8T5_KNICA